MLDMLLRCGAKDKTDFVFFNTGLEYQATLEHLDYLENRYNIKISRIRPTKPIPVCVREYGVPFWSKYVSDMIHRLQLHNFKWEDRPYEELLQEYPTCKTALRWWCDIREGKTTQYSIRHSPYLKEFMIDNPPDIAISDMCCQHTKKKMIHKVISDGGYDLSCVGIRKSEGGIRASAYKNCFSEQAGNDIFRPIFWLRDSDKEEYCKHYSIVHSRCYSEYGLSRTGCVGCPFGKNLNYELDTLAVHEPKLHKAAIGVFGKGYEYTQAYMEYRNRMKLESKKNDIS